MFLRVSHIKSVCKHYKTGDRVRSDLERLVKDDGGISFKQCHITEFYLVKSVSKFRLIIDTDNAESFITKDVIKSIRPSVELSPTKISMLRITRHALSPKVHRSFINEVQCVFK